MRRLAEAVVHQHALMVYLAYWAFVIGGLRLLGA